MSDYGVETFFLILLLKNKKKVNIAPMKKSK